MLLFNTIKKPNYVSKLNLKKIVQPCCRYADKRKYSTSSLPQHSTKIDQTKYSQLGSYLAGLIEGDGNIYTPGLDVKGAPQIEIVFDIRDF